MRKIILILAVFLGIFTAYAVTTSPYLQAGDSTEMAASAITLGVPHQPSYPLYILAAHAVTKLPIPYLPDIPPINYFRYNIDQNNKYSILIYRTGLSSALFQAAAATYFFLILLQINRIRGGEISPVNSFGAILIALFVTALYAFSETIWLYATKPEVFALNNLFAMALLFYALRWYTDSHKAKISARYFLLLGLAFSHHQTIILLFPVLFAIYLFKKQQLENTSIPRILWRWVSYPFDRKFNKSFPFMFCFFLAILPFFIALWMLAQRYPFINWGEVSGPVSLVRALIRADYGSIGAYLTNIESPTVAADQIPFFAQHLLTDFSLYVIILAVLGTIILYRTSKRLWLALMLFFLIAGPIFIMYANFSLEGDFSKATVVRFYMLPEIPILIFMFASLVTMYQKIRELDVKDAIESIDYQKIGTGIFLLLAGAITIHSIYQNKPNFDNLTYAFAKTAIAQTEDNAMILVTGDIPNMVMQYMQAVEGEKKNRIIFSPGQFHLAWFQKQLRSRYPTLKIPDPLPGKRFTSPSQVIDANFGKQPIYIVTDFVEIDPLIQEKYVLWPKNLLLKVEAKGVDYKLEKYLAENDALFQSLNLQEFAKLKSRKYQLESPLVFYYSRHFYNLGAVFNTVHRYQDAITQFKRALTIDAELADAYKALGTIYYFTEDFEPKDPQAALEYLYRYLQTTDGRSIDQITAVQNSINKINEDLKKAEEEEKKAAEDDQKPSVDQQEASESAESSPSAKLEDDIKK